MLLASGGPAVVDIHDVPIVPVAAVIPDWLPACCCWLHYFLQESLLLLALLLFWRSSVFAFIPAVVGGHAIVVFLVSVACCRCHCCMRPCYRWRPFFLIYSLMLTSLLLSFVPDNASVPADPGVPILASVLRTVLYPTGTMKH
jgi:hypothetical protein